VKRKDFSFDDKFLVYGKRVQIEGNLSFQNGYGKALGKYILVEQPGLLGQSYLVYGP
jgi:hypothetical protein